MITLNKDFLSRVVPQKISKVTNVSIELVELLESYIKNFYIKFCQEEIGIDLELKGLTILHRLRSGGF